MSLEKLSYEVQSYRNGKWSIVLVADDKDTAVFEAQRRLQSKLTTAVRVVQEIYDSETESYRTRVIFRRERLGMVGEDEKEEPKKQMTKEAAEIPSESERKKKREKRDPVKWVVRILFGVLLLASSAAAVSYYLIYEPPKPPPEPTWAALPKITVAEPPGEAPGEAGSALPGEAEWGLPGEGEEGLPAEAEEGPPADTLCVRAERIFRTAAASGAAREDALFKALALCPRHAPSLNGLALMRENQDKLDEAKEFYRKAIAANASFAMAYAGLGDVLKARGDVEDAAGAYKDFLRIAGDDPRLRSYVVKYRRRLLEIEKPPEPELVASAAIVDALTSRPPQQPQGRRQSVTGRRLDKPSIDIAILFDFDSVDISSASFSQMEEVSKALQSPSLQASKIMVEGHTDSIGGADYNMELSRRRAASVKRSLVERFGVSPERMQIRGMGETAPVDSNETVAGRARNRRVTFINLGE